MIAYENAGEAIDWLTAAFGFRESGERYTDDDSHRWMLGEKL